MAARSPRYASSSRSRGGSPGRTVAGRRASEQLPPYYYSDMPARDRQARGSSGRTAHGRRGSPGRTARGRRASPGRTAQTRRASLGQTVPQRRGSTRDLYEESPLQKLSASLQAHAASIDAELGSHSPAARGNRVRLSPRNSSYTHLSSAQPLDCAPNQIHRVPDVGGSPYIPVRNATIGALEEIERLEEAYAAGRHRSPVRSRPALHVDYPPYLDSLATEEPSLSLPTRREQYESASPRGPAGRRGSPGRSRRSDRHSASHARSPARTRSARMEYAVAEQALEQTQSDAADEMALALLDSEQTSMHDRNALALQEVERQEVIARRHAHLAENHALLEEEVVDLHNELTKVSTERAALQAQVEGLQGRLQRSESNADELADMLESVLGLPNEKQEHQAAVAIQSRFRGSKARQLYKQKQETKVHEVNATYNQLRAGTENVGLGSPLGLRMPGSRSGKPPAAHWSISEVGVWLSEELGLSQYRDSFRHERVDGPTLLALGKEELEELGIKSRLHCTRILAAVQQL